MPARVVKVQRAEKLGFIERLYVPMIAKGLFVTSRHFFRNLRGFITGKNRTDFVVQYPEERIDYPDAFRGMPVLVQLDNGQPKCVACGLCEFACPTDCISIVPGELPPTNDLPVVFFGHGITGQKENLFAIGSQLAAAGFVAVAIDWVVHGDRAIRNNNDPLRGCAGEPAFSDAPQCFAPILSSDLAGTERKRQLHELLRRAATEAFHLGFTPDEIESALQKALDELKFKKTRKKA